MSPWQTRLSLGVALLLAAFALSPALPARAVGYVECVDIEATNFDPDPACAAVMESHPVPTVIEVSEDTFTLSSYSYWKVITEGPPAPPPRIPLAGLS